MSRLNARSYLHLKPEDVEGPFDHPFYAQTESIRASVVYFAGLHDVAGLKGSLPQPTAKACVVSAVEAKRSIHASILRRGAAVVVNWSYIHGQVVKLQDDEAFVNTNDDLTKVSIASVNIVAPVVALLLRSLHFDQFEWSSNDMNGLYDSILSRITGDGTQGTRKITEILMDIVDYEDCPSPSTKCQWLDPSTRSECQIYLQHAIDFAYYVDGGINPVPQTVETSLCQPRAPRRQRVSAPETGL